MPIYMECVIKIYLFYITHLHDEQQNILPVNLKEDSTESSRIFCKYLLSLLLLSLPPSLPASPLPSLSTYHVDSSKDVPYIVAAVWTKVARHRKLFAQPKGKQNCFLINWTQRTQRPRPRAEPLKCEKFLCKISALALAFCILFASL